MLQQRPITAKLKKKKNVKENRFINIRQGGLRNQKENNTIIFASVKRSDCIEFTCKLKKSNTLNGKGLVDTESGSGGLAKVIPHDKVVGGLGQLSPKPSPGFSLLT